MYSRKMHILAEKHFEEKKIIFFAKTVQSISQQQHSEIGVQRMVPDHFPITFCLKNHHFVEKPRKTKLYSHSLLLEVSFSIFTYLL